MNIVYVLSETYEDSDFIREFNIVGVYSNIEEAKKTMKVLIEEDQYGFIEKNGIHQSAETWFETDYKDSFIAYDIQSCKVL